MICMKSSNCTLKQSKTNSLQGKHPDNLTPYGILPTYGIGAGSAAVSARSTTPALRDCIHWRSHGTTVAALQAFPFVTDMNKREHRLVNIPCPHFYPVCARRHMKAGGKGLFRKMRARNVFLSARKVPLNSDQKNAA